VGLVFMFACGGILIFVGQQAQIMQHVPEEVKTILAVVLGVQVVLYIIEIGALLTGDAKAYFDQ
jgi:hypothetical protein